MSAIGVCNRPERTAPAPDPPPIWEGLLPDGLQPEPGGVIRIAGRLCHIIDARNACGRRWRLELAAV